MAKEGFSGKMGHTMKETLLMDSLKDLESTILQNQINIMLENLGVEIWKEKEKKYGMMEGDMKETLKMVRKMEKVHLNFLMEINILGVGKMVNNMEQESYIQEKQELKDKESGLWEEELDGLGEKIYYHLLQKQSIELLNTHYKWGKYKYEVVKIMIYLNNT